MVHILTVGTSIITCAIHISKHCICENGIRNVYVRNPVTVQGEGTKIVGTYSYSKYFYAYLCYTYQ